jgi:hypothetical protein
MQLIADILVHVHGHGVAQSTMIPGSTHSGNGNTLTLIVDTLKGRVHNRANKVQGVTKITSRVSCKEQRPRIKHGLCDALWTVQNYSKPILLHVHIVVHNHIYCNNSCHHIAQPHSEVYSAGMCKTHAMLTRLRLCSLAMLTRLRLCSFAMLTRYTHSARRDILQSRCAIGRQ